MGPDPRSPKTSGSRSPTLLQQQDANIKKVKKDNLTYVVRTLNSRDLAVKMLTAKKPHTTDFNKPRR